MLGPSPVVQTGPAPVTGGREARDLRSLTGTRQYGTTPPAPSVLSASMPRFAPPPLPASSLRGGSAHDGRSPLGHCGAVYACRRLRASPSLRLVAPTRLRSASLVGGLLASCLPTAGRIHASGLSDKRRASGSASSTFADPPYSCRSAKPPLPALGYRLGFDGLAGPAGRPMLAAAARRHRAAKSGGHPAHQGTATLSYRSTGCLFPHIGTGHLRSTFGVLVGGPGDVVGLVKAVVDRQRPVSRVADCGNRLQDVPQKTLKDDRHLKHRKRAVTKESGSRPKTTPA